MTDGMQSVLSWMKGTDLVEVFYEKGGERLSLRLADVEAPVEVPPTLYLPITSPAVGVFRSSAPGRASEAEKGAVVKKGAALGYVESGGERVNVECPADGTLARVLAKEGQGVEYGRPLFLLEPK